MATLCIDEVEYSFDELSACAIDSNLPPYHASALAFCQRWQRGDAEFHLQTSGSTGVPKMITLTREQMTASAQRTAQAIGLQAGDRALVCLSTQHIAGIMMLVRGMVLGLHLTVVEAKSNPFVHIPPTTAFDFVSFVPLQLQTVIASEQSEKLRGMKAILVGGAPVSTDLITALQCVKAPVYHTYGMTETVSHIALRRLNGEQASEYFVPLPGVQIVLDERQCLSTCTPMTQNQWIQTNDIVELNNDGSFRFLGRADNIINSGGYKVQVEKVEHALTEVLESYFGSVFAGQRLMVIGLPDEEFGERVTAVIEGDDHGYSIADIRLALEAQGTLERNEFPRQLVFLSTLPETPSGKLDRQLLRKRLTEAHYTTTQH